MGVLRQIDDELYILHRDILERLSLIVYPERFMYITPDLDVQKELREIYKKVAYFQNIVLKWRS